jgi:hypothetical protein
MNDKLLRQNGEIKLTLSPVISMEIQDFISHIY